MNESVVRFLLAEELLATGVSPADLDMEHRGLGVGPIDLVVGRPVRTAFELKSPREPREKNAADTMAFGELLNDLCRLARLPVRDAFAVFVLEPRLRAYLGRRTDLPIVGVAGEVLRVSDQEVLRLPATARKSMRAHRPDMCVEATCLANHDVAAGALLIYSVRSESQRVSRR